MSAHRHPRLIGLFATLAVAGLLVGLPAVLLALGWGQLPNTPTGWMQWLTSPDDGRLVLLVLKVAAWITWLMLTVSILTELGAAVRGIKAPRLPGLGWSQVPARRLVAAATLLFVALPTIAGTVANASPAAAAPPAPITATSNPTTSAQATVSTPAPTSAASDDVRGDATYQVQQGDSLWSIAEQQLGSGRRYVEIAALNTHLLAGHDDFLLPGWVLTMPSQDATGTYTVQPGDSLSSIARNQLGDETRWPAIAKASQATTQADGTHLSDPDLIMPGWVMTLPDSPSTTEEPPTTATHVDTTDAATNPTGPADSEAAQPQPQAPDATASASAPTAAAPAPASPSAADSETAEAPQQHDTSAPWLLAGLTGAGSILAGGLFTLLRRRRQAQFRSRRPGRTIATPPAEVAPVEKTIITTGAAAAPSLTMIDGVLRLLADTAIQGGQPVPDLQALQVLPGQLACRFSSPVKLPDPWHHTGDEADDRRWSFPTATALDPAASRAPYPQLVTIGRDDQGHTWMVNLEALGTISLTGDPTYAGDFARYLAAEIAVNPWAADVRLDCIGVAAEVADLDPRRISHHPLGGDAAAASARIGAVGRAAAHAKDTMQRCATTAVDVPTGRSSDAGDELWTSHLILINATSDPDALDDLLGIVQHNPSRTGTTIALVNDSDPIRGIGVRLTSHGRVQLPKLGLDLVAVGLTPDEAIGCALLLAQAESGEDAPMPAAGSAGWRECSDAAGALNPELVLPRDTDPAALDEPADSILPEPDHDILDVAAVTTDDLEQLAPLVPAHVRQRVEANDTTLDADLADWLNADCPRPRLTLLGPIQARIGPTGNPKAAAKRRPFYTELLTFLAMNPDGVTADQLITAFGGTPSQIRKHITALRDWLGTDPHTGQRYLPEATNSPAAQARGLGLYQLVGVLVDIDLFRRLRLRGEAHGPEGITDLRQALDLVDGEPFSGQRELGWAWLADGVRVDQHAVCGVVDVAHILTTAALVCGDFAAARAATQAAIAAAPYEDTPQLDLAAIISAEGDHAAADRLLIEQVANRDVAGEGPLDLPPRTADILSQRHRWKTNDQVA